MKPLQQNATRRGFKDLLAGRGAEKHVELKKISIKKIYWFLFYVCVFLHIYMCTMCMQCLRSPEGGAGSLELQMTARCHVGAEN